MIDRRATVVVLVSLVDVRSERRREGGGRSCATTLAGAAAHDRRREAGGCQAIHRACWVRAGLTEGVSGGTEETV